MKKLLAVLLFLALPAFGQVTLTINGQPVTNGSVVITTGSVTPPPVCIGGQVLQGNVCVCPQGSWNGSSCVVTPPVVGYQVLPVYPISWPAGTGYITTGAPSIQQDAKTIRPFRIASASLLTATVNQVQLYENTYNLKVNISNVPGDMGVQGGVNPYMTASSGSDTMRFVANENGNSDQTLSQYGYKRLPAFPSGIAYVNVQAEGQAGYYLLYFR